MTYVDMNSLQEWPLGQIVPKCHNLLSIKFEHLTVTNACSLLEFAAQAITFSSCFNSLHIAMTCSPASDGAQFLQTLADDKLDTLQSLAISHENWFKDADECLGSLLVILSKQTELKTLNVECDKLTKA